VGRAIVLELARSSFDVAIHYGTSRDEAEEVAGAARAMGVRAMTVCADLTSGREIHAMFDEVTGRFGGLDALVNNAAVFGRTPPSEMNEADFDHHVDINLKAPYLCSVEAFKAMGKAGGCIVNVSDVAGGRPFSNFVPYCVSKAGLDMLTRSTARAFAPHVRVNAVAPGTVLFRDDEDESTRLKVVSRIPRGRVGDPEDVARLVRFLCLEADHITGAVIPVDGGRSLA